LSLSGESLVSTFAFKFNLYRYSSEAQAAGEAYVRETKARDKNAEAGRLYKLNPVVTRSLKARLVSSNP
jgi:hypothetical protein